MSDKIFEIEKYFTTLFTEDPKCELDFATDIECLVAIILSAQCTDRRVNIVTKTLFQKYKSVEDYANADLAELENDIRSTGFYHNKARNIIALCNELIVRHGGKVPCDIDQLVVLPGVGRKTANVFLAEWCKIPAIGVDTHVIRLSERLGLSKSKDPEKIEYDLKSLIPIEKWRTVSLSLVLFGRHYCTARNPKCDGCKIKHLCANGL